jgi:hypothetical protein
MAKTKRRIGAFLQTFGEGLGTGLQRKREFEQEEKREQEAIRQFGLTHNLAELYREAQIANLDAAAKRDLAEARQTASIAALFDELLGDGVTGRPRPVETIERLDTTAEPRFDTGPTATFPTETMTRQELGPAKLAPLQVDTTTGKFIDMLKDVPGSDVPGTLADDLIRGHNEELAALQMDPSGALMRGLGGDESERWGTIYAPLDQPGESKPFLTDKEKRRFLLEYMGTSATGVLGGAYADPASREEIAGRVREAQTEVDLAAKPIEAAQAQLLGEGGITTWEEMDAATGQTHRRLVPTRALAQLMVTGQSPTSGWTVRSPLAVGQQTSLAQIFPMWSSVETIQDLVPEFQERFDAGLTGVGAEGVTGPLAGRISDFRQNFPGGFGLDDDQFARMTTGLNILLNNTVRAITGAQMSNPEAERIKGQVPLISDRWPVFLEKLAATEKNLQAMAQSTAMNVRLDTYWEMTGKQPPGITIAGLESDNQEYILDELPSP